MDKCPKKNGGNKDNGLNKARRRARNRRSVGPQLSGAETLHATYLMNVRIRESGLADTMGDGQTCA